MTTKTNAKPVTATKPAKTKTATKAKAKPPASPPAAPDADPKPSGGKLGVVIGLLQQPDGTTLDALMAATGWQAHSVRGALAGAIKKKGHKVISQKTEAGRVYRIEKAS